MNRRSFLKIAGAAGLLTVTPISIASIPVETSYNIGDLWFFVAKHRTTIVHGEHICLSGHADFNMKPGEALMLIRSKDHVWLEPYRIVG